ncbi:hypothetical protein WICPIJ_001249 [Wickerhamomyces pijperi]|uniref:Uncharacterized protein n=1 Tax=Wickerhamomyces pijperi TaxID=599730 RepID=A0A9P8QDQ0_WICPI|nr:hypothetical protein WICPIJ_001249 [Wickerhamomyces pijperi]
MDLDGVSSSFIRSCSVVEAAGAATDFICTLVLPWFMISLAVASPNTSISSSSVYEKLSLVFSKELMTSLITRISCLLVFRASILLSNSSTSAV